MALGDIKIIAEAGVNHNGSLELAKHLVDAAKNSGADFVKFQTYNIDKLVSRTAKKAPYQAKSTGGGESQLEMLKRLSLSKDNFVRLKRYCDKRDIQFISSPFDEESVDFLCRLDVPLFKIPSGEITNFSLLGHIAQKRRPMLLSTGFAYLSEVASAVEYIASIQRKNVDELNLVLLHCQSQYPADKRNVNLKAMFTLANSFPLSVGYSDHTSGIEIAIAAAALGASVIEKHLTLDKRLEGPDHRASLTPNEFRKMVECIRNVESALGDGIKRPTKGELENLEVTRKSLCANRSFRPGHIIKRQDLSIKRPGNGIPPRYLPVVIGMRLGKGVGEDEVLLWEHFKPR